MQPSLGGTAARGALTVGGAQAIKFVLQFGGLIALARLLNPTDYGLIAMVMAIVGVAEIIRDFGLSAASVQARDLTDNQKSNLFWINTVIGAMLMFAALGLATPISQFYDEPTLVPLTQALSVSFLLNGIATQFRANMSRSLQFRRLVSCEILSQASGLTIGVGMALGGFSYWSIVGQQLGQSLVLVVLLGLFGRWRPGLPKRRANMRGLLSFGGGLMGAQLLQYASKNIDAVVIGYNFGASSLGSYNRASQLVNNPLAQINAPASSLALPILSRLQDDSKRYNAFLLKGQQLALQLIVFSYAFAAAVGDAAVVLVLGSQWEPAAPIFQILAIGAVFQAVGYATYWAFVSKGKTGALFRYSLCSRVITISAILAGAYFGVMGVAIAFTCGVAFLWPFALYWVSRVTDVPARQMFLNAGRSIFVYGVGAGVAYVATNILVPQSPGLRIVIGLAIMCAVIALFAACSDRVRADLKSPLELREMRRK